MFDFKAWLFTFACVLAASKAFRIDGLPDLAIKVMVSTDERIRSHGYPAETHKVETTDGYVLSLFRIPYSHKLQNENAKRPVVLLQHGLLSNSDCFISSGPDNSLAYLLADAGYDVWLGNARGNIYSRENTKMSLNHIKFWHFDWHEIGIIDIPAMIDYILDVTGEDSLHYAGHSQGTTVYFVLMSERPEYNAKIKSAHMLAPCAYLGHGTAFVYGLLHPLVGKPGGFWNQLLVDTEVIPHNTLMTRVADNSCGKDSKYDPMCFNMFVWFANGGYENTNLTSLQVLIETHPGGSSSNQMIHYLQSYDTHKFRQYDWGTKKNRKLYGQDSPPDYDLSKITAPTHLYSSQNDGLCAPRDVDKLVSNFPLLVEDYRIPWESFNHLDFIMANNMKELLNDLVVERINSYEA